MFDRKTERAAQTAADKKIMAEDTSEKAYIKTEREDNDVKYMAKVSGEPPRQISKKQYNAIVKALRAQDWATTVESEASVINQIIGDHLKEE